MADETYKITRFFQDESLTTETIETGLTLEQAQQHCNSPESSSRTATTASAQAITEKCGAWFDGYGEESA